MIVAQAFQSHCKSICSALQVILGLLVWLLVSQNVLAGMPLDNLFADGKRNLLFSRLSTDEGLSQAGINSIVQDRYGFIWIGTQEGLNRYDGNEFIVYEHDSEDPTSLPHNWVWTTLVDDSGSLWVGTDGGGLSRYDPGLDGFIHFRHDPQDESSLSNNRVRVIYQDHQGELWIGTDGGGLNRFDHGSGRFIRFRHQPGDPDSLPNDSILDILEDRHGKLWIATNGGGLAVFDRKSGKFSSYRHDPANPRSLSHDRVRVIYEDRDGLLLVGTYEGGLNVFDRTGNDFSVYKADSNQPQSLGHNRVRDILQDSNGSYWIATDNGLSQWLKDQGRFVTYRNDPTDNRSLSDNRVVTLFQDRGGVLWVGTYNGLNRWNYASDAFKYLDHADSLLTLSHRVVTAIDGSSNGEIWVGTYGGGLNRLDLKHNRSQVYRANSSKGKGLSDDRVMSVFVDERDIVWVGTRSGGLNRLDPDSGQITVYRHHKSDPDSISSDSVTTIYGEANGILWIGTYSGGLNRFDTHSETFTAFRHDPENPNTIGSDRVVDIFRDSHGVLWVGTEGGGLNRFNDVTGTFVRYQHDPDNPDSLSSNFAWQIWESREGSLWVGTNGGGLNQVTPESRASGTIRFKKYQKNDGLVSDTILGIQEDNNGNLWLTSNRGLMQFQPGQGIRIFNHLNGLKSSEFNFNAQYRNPSGYLFFGGPAGLLVFHPSDILTNLHKPEIAVTLYNRSGPLRHAYSIDPETPALEIGYRDDWINFYFAGLDFAAPSKNRFLYKLEGFDHDWNDPGKSRNATYTNLGPGDYTFNVKSANNDGIWNHEGSQIHITVLPPPWQTLWAYLGYVAMFLGLIVYLIYRHRRKYAAALRQQQKLEKIVSERTQELENRNKELVELNHKLKAASSTDSLTGLKNRRFLDDFIEPEINAIDRQLQDLTVENKTSEQVDIAPGLLFMMIDLDGFKQINDNHGHYAGDQALIQVRNILKSCCRQSDIIIRWGGDEFLIIGRHANPAIAAKLAERIRQNLADHHYQLGRGAVGRMSGSIGFALYPFVPLTPGFCTWEQVIGSADRAAYVAKENGRNAWVGLLGSKQTKAEDLLHLKDDLQLLIETQKIKLITSISGPIHLTKPSQSRTSLR